MPGVYPNSVMFVNMGAILPHSYAWFPCEVLNVCGVELDSDQLPYFCVDQCSNVF